MQVDNLDSPPTQRAFTVAQAAVILGTSRFTTHRLVQLGRIKPIAGFDHIKISAGELDRFLSATGEYRPTPGRARYRREVAQ
jgi:excisionase family DNA binding protein